MVSLDHFRQFLHIHYVAFALNTDSDGAIGQWAQRECVKYVFIKLMNLCFILSLYFPARNINIVDTDTAQCNIVPVFSRNQRKYCLHTAYANK